MKPRFSLLLALSLILSSQVGCGVLVGTIVDTGVGVAVYPVQEYIAMGAYEYDNTWDKPYTDIAPEKDHGELVLGVCISGGGSRSAYFMACVLEELGKKPLKKGSSKMVLDEVDYISSVSGGSLASAYYCLKCKDEPELSREQFFKQYRAAMSMNFELQSLIRLMFGYWVLDFFTYYDRADLIASVWDSEFFNNATFADLAEAERLGAPSLIVNGTCLTTGLKFVFSTLPDDRFNASMYFRRLNEQGFIRNGTTGNYTSFRTIGFQFLNSDIAQYPVSKAVAASASVPNLLGPVSLQMKPDKSGRRSLDLPKDTILNVTDGGIYDNYGLESVMQVVTAYLDKHPGAKARIIVVDGSGFFDVGRGQSDAFNVAYYAERTLAISWLRTKAYMEYVFQRARAYRNAQGQRPYRNLNFDVVSLYGILPSQERVKYLVKTDDAAVQKILRPDVTAAEFFKKITTIQTRFKISQDDSIVVEDQAKRSCSAIFR